jgi:8-oxo-dGTP diphosphatase
VPLPYKIATLLYCFNEQDDVLLMEREQEPNLGLWSPPGGKLKQDTGESPHTCAAREAHEEIAISLRPNHLQLTGIVSEPGYAGQAHCLIFIFEFKKKITATPQNISEGRFQFFSREQLDDISLPQTDREMVWPLFWQHRGMFFTAHCLCGDDGHNEWTLEQSSLS